MLSEGCIHKENKVRGESNPNIVGSIKYGTK
jgi:hypothetical protein